MARRLQRATIGRMTPDDLTLVRRSWTELRRRRAQFLDRLEAIVGGAHAHRLIEAADELVDLLAAPSGLAVRARTIAAAWPESAPLPRLDVDGAAWRHATAQVQPGWSTADDEAWRHAWLLLADVLAEDFLTPFDAPRPERVVPPAPAT